MAPRSTCAIRTGLFAAACALSLASGGRALAADADAASPIARASEIEVEDEAIRPAEVFEDRATETEVLTERDLEKLPATDAAEALAKLPGIRVQQRLQGEEGAVSIEGLPPSYTLVLVNDLRYSGEIGDVDDLRDVPLANVERVELLRGAQGLRYGSEAAGGVINFITKDPPESAFVASGLGGVGDDENRQLELVGGAGGATFGGNLALDFDRIAGFDAPNDRRGRVLLPSGSDSLRTSYDAYATAKWQPTSAFTSRTRAGYRLEQQDLAGGSTDAARWLASESFTLELGPETIASGGLHYFRGDLESDIGRAFELVDDEWRLDLAVDRSVEKFGLHVFTLGIDARTTSLDLRNEATPGFAETSVHERIGRGGAFVLGESELADWLTLEYGVRGQFHTEFSPRWLPQAGVLVTPWRGELVRALKLRFSVGRNHRAPSLRELHQPPVPQIGGSYFLAGNEDLDTETSTSYRAGIELQLRRSVSLAVVGFWNEIEDHIRSSIDGAIQVGANVIPADLFLCNLGLLEFCSDQITPVLSPLFRKQNLDRVRIRGIEARAEWRPHRRVELMLGYTFLDTRVVDSNVQIDELPNEPAHVVDALVSLRAPRTETELTLRGRWRGEALTETSGTGLLSFASTARSDPSLVLDLRVSQPIGSHFHLFADLRNATSERFVDSYIVRGRSFLAGVRADFD